ncbi:hypothetical protein [Pseudomonas mediterranea]|uniref:hypothetical protein n=1 Tax=Pseudomonas mediterranea TaxID=183795 RepID=UPI0006D8CC46|nr:hypothetical protein [Pseudomonas mediterranea]
MQRTKAPKASALAQYIRADRHLIDPSKGLTAANLKSSTAIAKELEMTQPYVSKMIREKHPEVAAVATTRDPQHIRKVKLPEFVRYISTGGHLRDPALGDADLHNIRTHTEIMADLGLGSWTVTRWIRDLYPALAQRIYTRSLFQDSRYAAMLAALVERARRASLMIPTPEGA